MNQLRTQLDAARAQYQSARYPGDLTADVVPDRRSRAIRWVIGAAAMTGLAAAITLMLFMRQSVSTTLPQISGPTAVVVRPAGSDFSIVPEFPPDFNIVPSYQAFTPPALPSFPSLETADQADSSNARESV